MPRGRPKKASLAQEPQNRVTKQGRGRPRKTAEPSLTNGVSAAAAAAAEQQERKAKPSPTSPVKPVWIPPITDPSTTSTTAHLAHARKHIAFLLTNSPIYTHLLLNVELIAASPTHVVTRLRLEPHHLNSMGSLHGSVTATFVDFIGGVAIACSDLRQYTGVSTDIHVSYCGKAATGDTVDIEGVAEKVGATLAFTRVVVRTVELDGSEGRLVAMGRHTKYVKQR